MKNFKPFYICIGIILIITMTAQAAAIISPVNHKPLKKKGNENYSFILTAHTYGTSSTFTIYPASNILANIATFNNLLPDFMVILGDIVVHLDDVQIKAFSDSFGSKVNFPIFNAVGNHDITNRSLYKKHFGKTYYAFRHQSELFVMLDSEKDPGKISEDQIVFLNELFDNIEKDAGIKNAFLFSQRLIWPVKNRPPETILPNKTHGPQWHTDLVKPFNNTIMKRIEALQAVHFFLCSADIGSAFIFPVFYDHIPESNITYIATRLNDNANDAVIIINVENGSVRFDTMSLAYKQTMPLENYNFDYWIRLITTANDKISRQQSNVLKQSKIQKLLTNRFYLFGFFSGMLFLAGIMILQAVNKKMKKTNTPAN